MKVKDVVKKNQAWKELFHVITDTLDAGGKAKDGGLYTVGLRLTRIVAELGDIDIVPEEEHKTPSSIFLELKMEDKAITWEEWEKLTNQAVIDSINIAIGELEKRGVTESERKQLVTMSVLLDKLCLKRTV